MLLPSTERLRLQTDRVLALVDDQSTDSFWPIELVSGEAHEIDSEGGDVDGKLADGLGRIDMQQGTDCSADSADGSDIVDGSDFIVSEHDRDHCSLFIDRRLESIEIDAADALGGVAQDGEEFDRKTIALQTFEASQRRRVFDGTGKQLATALSGMLRSAEQGELDAFGGSAGEDDGFRIGMQSVCNRFAAAIDLGGDSSAGFVARAARVPIVLEHPWQHRLHDAWIGACGRVIVEIDFAGQGSVAFEGCKVVWWWQSEMAGSECGYAHRASGLLQSQVDRTTLTRIILANRG